MEMQAAVEPGSGSTIMAYTGICDTDNIQGNSDAYFHFSSYNQIVDYVINQGGNSCPTTTATGNNPPTVNAGINYIIPLQTPFALTATGMDINGDTLTYAWEESDLGPSAVLSAPDNGMIPLFRSRPPTTNNTRIFPQLSDILNNTNSLSEKLPVLARTLNFRVTVQDNKTGGGGVCFDDTQITVVTSAGPFQVTAPNTAVTWSGSQTVTWNVAGSQTSPVNAANVNILLSTDGGQTFTTVLSSNTSNDGSQLITLPVLATTNARIKVEAAQNIFFDISDANFTIQPPPGTHFFTATGVNTINDSAGNGNGNGSIDPGENNIQLFVQLMNSGTTQATGINGVLTSLMSTATMIGDTSIYPNLSTNATGSNSIAFVIYVDPTHPCGADINLQLLVSSNEGSNSINLRFTAILGPFSVTNAYTVASAIPDPGITNISFTVNQTGSMQDLNFSFDGTSCSTDSQSTSVGISHSYVGDLIVTLISPDATEVIMINTAAENCNIKCPKEDIVKQECSMPKSSRSENSTEDKKRRKTWNKSRVVFIPEKASI
ncbi:MAG: hypothetical protein GKR87_10680 [Kiritimatiellae bacterium]|nr:hypothetical protein [Kiritimatiellia bacterium]